MRNRLRTLDTSKEYFYLTRYRPVNAKPAKDPWYNLLVLCTFSTKYYLNITRLLYFRYLIVLYSAIK